MATTISGAGSAPAELNAAAATRFLDSWLSFQDEHRTLPGFAVCILNDSNVLYSRAFGWADIENREPLTTSQRYCFGSQAKMVTAACAMQLASEGLLDLDAPIETYLEWLDNHQKATIRDITTRQLLTHTARLPRDGSNADFWQGNESFPDRNELCTTVLETQPMRAEIPSWKYSNLGFAITGQIIESVTKTSYADYVDSTIFGPLGLHGVTAHDSVSTVTSYGKHERSSRMQISSGNISSNAFSSAAGISGSVVDSARLVRGLATRFRQTWNELREVRAESKSTGGPTAYGAGLELINIDDFHLAGHSGGFLGVRSCAFRDDHSDMTVAVMSNCIDAPVAEMCVGIFGALKELSESNGKSDYEGIFSTRWDEFQIVDTGKKLVTVDPNSWMPFRRPQEELVVVDEDTLLIDKHVGSHFQGEHVEYIRDDQGQCLWVRHAAVRAERIK